jgi:hypothetical protein
MPESEEGHIASSERLTDWQLTGFLPSIIVRPSSASSAPRTRAALN